MQTDAKLENGNEWWEKPGLGVMYQIEARPGWIWNRNYDKFNSSMKDQEGNFEFNGPFCKMKKWVGFSQSIGIDYHVFEVKWHDGICYFDTKYTNWKTPIDYCEVFSEESKKNGIPFMFYYSSIFDHNPQFDDIQPLRSITPSFIARHHENKEEIAKYSKSIANLIKNMSEANRKNRNIPSAIEFFDDVEYHDFTYNPQKYEKYLLQQIRELIDNYKPDGMWMDWYWGNEEASTFLVMDLMEKNYPDVILTYNASIERVPRYIHYLSGEAHDVNTAWRAGNNHRNKKKPWELCGPAAYAWDVPIARSDPYEIFRIAVIIMANGGKFCFGLPSQMDGELYPEPAKNLELFGEWYKIRKDLFTESIPMKYEGEEIPGVIVKDTNFGAIGSTNNNNNLIHLVNFEGVQKDIVVSYDQIHWGNIEKILLEPSKKQLELINQDKRTLVTINKADLDVVDTILRIIK